MSIEIDYEIDGATVAGGLFAIAKSLDSVAYAIRQLGNGDACTQMGAIEAYSVHIGEKMDALADAIRETAGR